MKEQAGARAAFRGDRSAGGSTAVDGRFPLRGRSRLWVACLGLALVAAGVLSSSPTVTLCGLVMSTAALLASWAQLDLALVAAVFATFIVLTSAAMLAAWMAVDLLALPELLALVYLVYAVVVLAMSARPASRPLTRPVRGGRWVPLAFAPSLVAVVVAFVQQFSDRAAATWAFLSTDLAEHLILLAGVQRSGGLDYAGQAYPRGLHAVVALVSVPRMPRNDPSMLLIYDVRAYAALTWLCLAAMLLAASVIIVRAGDRLSQSSSCTVTVAVVVGLLLLAWRDFVSTFMFLGAGASILASSSIWCLPLAAIATHSARQRALLLPPVLACTVFVLAHSWQALIAAPVVAGAAYAASSTVARALISLGPQVRSWGWRGPLAALVTLLLLMMSLPPLVSAAVAGGVSIAGLFGLITPVPLWLVVVELLVSLTLAWRWHSGWARLHLGAVLGLIVATGVLLLGAGNGFQLDQWYPMKSLWMLMLVVTPIAALILSTWISRIWRLVTAWVARLGPAAFVGRVAVASAFWMLSVAFLLPWVIVDRIVVFDVVAFGAEPGQSERRLDIALTQAQLAKPRLVVPIDLGVSPFDGSAAFVVSRLLSFQTGQAENGGRLADACRDIETVADGGDVVVVTTLPAGEVRAAMLKQGCSPPTIVSLPGRSQADQRYGGMSSTGVGKVSAPQAHGPLRWIHGNRASVMSQRLDCRVART